MRSRSAESGKPLGIVGKIVGSFFFLIFLAAGLFFEVMVARMAIETLDTYSWKETPCEILESSAGIDETAGRDDDRYVFKARYRYTFEGVAYESDRFTQDPKRFGDISKAESLAREHPTGSQATCYVDPDAPGSSVFQRRNLATLLLVLFPLIFVAVGAGGIYAMWRSGKGRDDRVKPISETATKAEKGAKFVIGFCSLFVFVGLAVGYFLLVRPALLVIDARDWSEVECHILSSRVQAHRGDDSTTYSVDVLYRYEFGGQKYRSSRFRFLGGSSSGSSAKHESVRRYPAGSTRTCFVNAKRPGEAVLERQLGTEWLFGLIPLAFVILGSIGVTAGFKQLRKERGESAGAGLRTPGSLLAQYPVALKPASSRIGILFGLLFVAVFWNGIVSVFVWQAIEGIKRGKPEWFLVIFLIPFIVIGLVLIGALFPALMKLANPRVTLVLHQPLTLGGEAELSWMMTGRASAVSRLKIELEGREEATYRRGTSSYTDKETFAKLPIASATSRGDVRGGKAAIQMPANQMHSFEASNNKIIWTLRACGDITDWPDINDEFPVRISAPAPRRPATLPSMKL